MNKKNIGILVLLIVVTGVILIIVGKSIATKDSSVLREQEVENLVFKEAEIKYENGISKLEVEVENKGEDLNLKYIDIKVEKENENIRLIGYIGDSIKSKETKLIEASVDQDITDITNITYTIVK